MEREGRDSNPRGSFTPPTRLAGGCFRPLSHLPDNSGPSFDSIRPQALSILSTRWKPPADQARPRCGGPDARWRSERRPDPGASSGTRWLRARSARSSSPSSTTSRCTNYVFSPPPPALLLQQQDLWICLVGPFSRATVGYFRSSDVHIDLSDGDGRLTSMHERAGPGNVSVGAEIGIRAGAFQLAIGFAHSRADAEEVARTSLQKGAGAVRQSFERAWRAQPEIPPALGKVSGDDGMLARASFALLHCLEDKSHAGAFIAAPAAPWGEYNHDGNHVYHLVWPRDLCRIATALLDAGDSDAALRAFRHLQSNQRSDGGWYQNWTLDGAPHWVSTELDQVALPIP